MASEKTVELPRPELSAAKRALIEARLRGQVRPSGIVPRVHRDGAPLSFAQERLWFIDRLEPGSATYNIPLARRLGGALDTAALDRALGEIVRRHEALRTIFREVDGSPVQVVAPFGGFALRFDDLSGLAEADREVEMRRRVGEEAELPFDLTAGPLFRAALLRLDEESHVLLLSMHHIVSDGWSMGVFFRELSALYAAYREGRDSPLPELAVQYADYAVWQREHLRGEMLERQLSYWRERLGGAPELLELPTDHPRPAVRTFRGAHERIELPGELLERLRSLGRSEEATLYMVVLSAFQVLLSKYSGSEDIVVGSPVAGRARDEVAGLIGFFVNTLVLRTDVGGDPSFREVLRRVREVTLGAYEHQELPFEKLVAELQPERSLSHSPLFQVSFGLEDVEESGNGMAELSTEAVDADFSFAKFDLTLAFVAKGRDLRGAVSYSTDLFERGTIVRMLRHMGRLLEEVAVNADVRLSGLGLLGEAERALVLETWNGTERPCPRGVCIHELFEAQVKRTPDAVAVAHEDRSLTYAELNARANRLAHHLRALGVVPDARVAVCVERSPALVVALLGILKAGGAYVPLDPAYPAERLRHMLADSAPRAVLTQASLAGLFADAAVPVLEVADQGAWAHRPSADPAGVGLTPEHLAYVIYTSGSTGQPKGTLVPHRALPGFFRSVDYVRFDEAQVLLQHSSLSWDALTLELWPALASGGVCVLFPGRMAEPAALAEQVRAHGVTTLWLTSAYFNTLVDGSPDALAGVRQVMVGGEAVSPAHLRRALELYPELRLVNGYGPSECTVFATAWPVPHDFDGAAIPIGRAIGDRRVYVLDRHLQPVPVGVAGELFVGGPAVARGYLNQPRLTAERFVPDPFSADAGARLYRTGDLGRWRTDGMIEFLGRNDHQVKVRGFRIELREIEARLLAHPEVREATVLAREDAPGDRRLVAYYVGADGAEVEQLRAHLSERLPEYMVPAAYVRLERLPLTPNGKVDLRALPAPKGSSYATRGHEAPRTPVEEVLAGIWAEVLRLERVGVHDGFFDLGGHSLLATRVVSRVRELFGVELPLRALFEGPTVAELAGRVEEMRRAGLPTLPPVAPTERTGALPLSFAQERLWFIDRLEPGSTIYNIPAAWRLGGALDGRALERTLGEIARRHEALRTTFTEVDGSPVQVIAPFGGFTLPVEDLSGLSEADREAALRKRAGEEAARPFDLSAGPLFRAGLLRLGEGDHVLLLSMHHIVSDGWSMGVLFRELSALYTGYSEGGESPLAELGVQYADYAVWQREQLAGEALERQLAYWKERLAGAPELLELPTDRPRPAVRAHQGVTVPVELSLELLERLQALGRGEGATLYMTLLGAFKVLLSKYIGSEDVVVGSSIAGRTRGEVEPLIGFFVNTLVLRTDLSGDPSFREVLRRVREATLGAYEHQEVPFERLVAELQPVRSMSHSPLFQVSFSLNDPEGSAPRLPGLRIESAHAGSGTAKFDLSLAFIKGSRGLRGGMTYSTDLFDGGTIRRMLGHLERVLEQAATNAELRLSELRLLGEAERALVLEEWNRTEAEYPAGLCIHHLFEAQAERRPAAAAVVYEGAPLSYAELNARANQLAHHLVALGVGPDVRVGICMERSLEMAVALLALLKAGGAYVPLDPAHPAERLRQMLDDSRPAALLTNGAARELFANAGVPVVDVEADAAGWADQLRTNPERTGLTPDHLCYVIFTSGSTGRPKGVMNQHRTVVNRVRWVQRAWRLGADEAILGRTSLSFDGSVRETFWPWSVGARVVMAGPEGHRDPDHLLKLIRQEHVGTVSLVPSLLQVLLEHPEVESCSELRQVVCTGEALPSALLHRFKERLPHVAIHNLYGPSEAATAMSASNCTPEDARATVPIGRPTGNVRAYLLDGAGQPVPVGVSGELFIGGVGVTRGYLDQPELTAERFVPDPYGDTPGERLYRTGDLARWLADGRMEFLGRNDFQVKIRGFLVEVGEIEAVVRRHEGVADCAVMARAEAGERRLVAYVVGSVETDALRAHVRRSLPEYMVPAAFVVLERLPLTPNGKLDRRALPAPELGSAQERYVAPRTPTEEVLAGVWGETLRLERVGVEESFFELGGHSLLATRVVSRVRELFGVELPLRALFEGPTISELAGRVEEMRRAGLPTLPPVVPVERTGPLPLSFAQERLWFIDRLEPGSAVYNIPVAWRLGGALDEAALERALGEIVRRHEALRTVFREVDGSPVQVVAPLGGFVLPVEDLSGLGEVDREAALRRRAREEAAQPFDLSAGPLFRAALLRLGEEDHVLLLSMHHIVSDGWSMGVLRRELSALYAAYREGRESPLPELAVQYADYAVWQREQLRDGVLKGELEYWREQLSGAPELLELPTDHPRPAAQSFRGANEHVQLPAAVLERLRALGRQEGATLYMVALGAFQALLSRYSGSEDVVVGSPIAGRTRGETEGLIGFFVNTLVLRTDVSGDPSLRELLGRVREVTLGAYEHQEVPFERLVAELSPERSLSHSPLFQVAFTLNNAQDTGGGLAGLSVQGVGTELEVAKFDLSLGLTAGSGGLRGGLTYSTDLWEAATMQRLVGHFTRLVEQAAADPDVRISRVTLLNEAERRQVVEEWNRTPVEYPTRACIHELVAAQAERTAEALAVVCGEEALTYRELDARADRLARRLAGLGAGPEVRVGVCLERSAGMVVALLAVLKAGAAYLPLDPAYPADRLAYMLADSGARVLVTAASLRGILSADGVQVVLVDGDGSTEYEVRSTLHGDAEDESLSHSRTFALSHSPSPDNAAYVIYTSGSTGRPKGVVVTHANAANLLPRAVRTFGAEPGSAVLQTASMSFDASLLEVFVALLSGAALHVADRETVLAPERLAALLRQRRIGVWVSTPALLESLPDSDFPALRAISTGGERCPAETAARWSRGRRLVNMYGPTETTIYTTAHECAPGVAQAPPIGRPVQGARVYVLDAWGEPAPVGVPGELYVGGGGVARGYLDRPALTAERFLPDPFPGEGGARMYRTGDRVRWRGNGTLEFMGRLDEQVKVRGFRIELGEIEGALRRSEVVADCVVVAREDVPGEKRLVAYVVGDVEAGLLREHLRRELPEYMVPAAFVPLERLPLTPSGKLDRRALPAPERVEDDGYIAPRTPVEEVLAGIYADVLKLERVGAGDDFFALGGHSLLATRVTSRVRAVFGVELALRALFEAPTVGRLAEQIVKLRAENLGTQAPPVLPVPRDGRPLPLSFAQQRLWFLEQLGSVGSAYHIPAGLRLQGTLDRDALVGALDRVVARHEALRTTFVQVDGTPLQRISPAEGSRFHLLEHDLGAHCEPEAELRPVMIQEACASFDLVHGPLIRGRLVRLAEDDHVLLLTMHHIVSDGWSMGVLINELSALYGAFHRGEPDPLPPLPMQYADYAVWQRRWVAGEVLQQQAEFWKRTLAGAPELLELPADHPRPAQQDHAGTALRVELDESLVAGLKALSARHGTTLFMTLLTGWATVLSRLSGQEDVVIGTPSANRGRAEIEGLIGFFVNTLALRVDLSGSPTVAELLGRVKTQSLAAQQHQDIPFEQVVEGVQPVRSLSHSPLFQVLFAWQNAARGSLELPGLRSVPMEAAPRTTAKFDLSLALQEAGGRIAGGVEYATALFERATVERYLGYLRRALESMVKDDQEAVDHLPLLSQAERRQVVEGWNASEAEYPREACIHELFEAQVERTPDAVAVVSEGERVTYAELNAQANRLAHHLRDLGVAPDARVGICVERSVEMVVGLLAVLKAGGAYVPLDSSYPVDRLRCMLEDSAPAVLLTHPPLAATVAELAAGSAVPVLDLTARAAWEDGPAENPDRDGLGPENLAHVLFTSGSTGRPKGVMLEHGSLVNRLAWMQYRYAMEPHEALLQKTPFSFDVSFWEFFWPLMVGARLVMARPGGHRDPAYLVEVIRREGVTVAHFVPSMLPLFLEHPDAPTCSGLLRVPVSGEAVSAALARQFHERLPGVGLYNQYGPTESGEVTEWECAPGLARVSIGRAIHNSAVYVLDRAGEPVHVGVAGELFIGGVAVARGYLGRPRLTAERFVPDPFGEPGARMYRTGDLCRWLPDGTLEYLGRTDFQVKVRGFRIELGEIETRLLAHPQVREALVVAREDAPGDKRLVAYYVGAEGVEAEKLRAHLSERLPVYMVPSAFVALDGVPLTPNGKVDRRALPAPERVEDEGYIAPRTPAEEVLAGIYADVLKLERVGAGDDFFALGGHSLLATRVTSRVRAVFGVELALRALFEAPTVGRLAEQIVKLRAENLGTQAPPVLPVPRDGRPLPLSFAQQRLWFVDRLQPGRTAYHMPSQRRVRGVLDLAALERALSEVVRRHESLRTCFPMRDGEPVQQVDPAGRVRLPVADLGGLHREAREAEMERLAAREARRPFDLAAGPLLRGTVLRLADDDAVVLLTLHHIVSDGWSMGILAREASTLYESFARGEESRLPELPIQYADYAVWQREWLRGEVLQAQIGYWRARLAGAPALLELPTDRPRPLVPGDAGAGVRFTAGAEISAALRRLSRREGTTLFMTLLAAWQLLLSRYSGQEDVVVGSPIAGRNRLETEGLIGFFINNLVLRADLSGDLEFGELLRRVRESTLGAYQHQELPFEKLVEELGVERSQAYTPLFQVMFILQNNESNQLRLGEAAVEHLGGAAGPVKFDLALYLQETGEEIHGVFRYRNELWREESIRRMAEHYGRVLEAVAAHPERKLSQVPLLGEEERAQLLAESSAPEHHYPERLAHELFECQAARTPQAVALVLGEDSLSYGELDRRANRLARHLRGRGVGAEVRVAVFLERSFGMVIGVLAILKAGGAYVPLDPSYPAERLAYQVEDSGATLLVTTRELLEQLGSTPADPVLVDTESEAIGRESDTPPPCPATPENLSYVVYTSGSTGRPKGVMVPHRGVVSYLASVVQEYGLGPGDVVLQRSTLSFDASVRDLLGPLTAGARVVLVHAHDSADPVLLMRRIHEHRVSAILAIVPSVLRPLLDAAEEVASPASLRLILVSGEPLTVADCHRAHRAFGSGVRVVNLWGATECTLSSSFHTVEQEDGEGIAPVGVPIPNTRIYVLDAQMQPAPRGVAGEAYIAGVGLTRGYQNQPGLTAERFLPDPFGAAPGARIYRVGDRVRRRADGRLEFLGRLDQQVKVRGIRVETGEVEAVLRAHTGVRDAVVVAQDAAPGETRLVAYVAGEEEALTAGALRSSLERTLPAHMIPSVLVRLAELPLLPNGKVDRAALPAPVSGAWRDGRRYVAPSTVTERVLVEIWESLLDIRPIGVDDHFFRLGGHSMLAVRLMTQIRRRLGVEVPLAALFEHPTVRGLATRMTGEPRPRPWSPLVVIQPHGDRVPIFFVHPVGGEVLCYSDLARELGPEQPFYGLQAGDLVHLGEEEASIEEMAARYVAAIREVRPKGPYLLGGWSFGGFVAFEMAQQITRDGESVPLVTMLDTRSPGERRPADLDPCIRLAGMARAEALAVGKEISLTADDLRPLDPDARISRVQEVLRAAGVVPVDVEVGWLAAFLRGSEVRMRSALRYEPKLYPGRVAMFVPSKRNAGPEFHPLQDDASLPGWEAYVSEPLLKQTVPGDHHDMVLGENAAGLASHLRALIEESLLAAHA